MSAPRYEWVPSPVKPGALTDAEQAAVNEMALSIWNTGSQPPGTIDGLVGLLRAEHAAIKDLPEPTTYFLNPAYVDPWFRSIEAHKRHAEHRRVMLWKYRKLRGMPLPPEPVS